MDKPQKDPIYIHAAIVLALAGLVYLLIQAIFILPVKEREKNEQYKLISQLQIENISKAQNLYKLKYSHYTDDFDTLFAFLQSMKKLYNYESIFTKSGNLPFVIDSMRFSPKTHSKFILLTDTTIILDTIFNKEKKIVAMMMGEKIIGKRLRIKCPDGYEEKILH